MTTLTYSGTTIDLPDNMLWTDEFAWQPVQISSNYSVGGALLLDYGVKLSGRPITLECGVDGQWMRRSTVLALQAWTWLPAPTMTLNLRGVNYTVTWSPTGSPMDAVPVVDYSNPLPTDFMYVTLRLIVR